MFQNFGRELVQQPAALYRGQLLPHCVVAPPRRVHCRVNIVGIAALNLFKWLPIRRVNYRNRAA